MEQWDLYDEHRVKINKTIERGKQISIGRYHIVVGIIIINSENKMLIQKRQPFKIGWPDMWDITVAGSALAGEGSNMAASRELFEELGYKHNFENERPVLTVSLDHAFQDFYLIKKDVDINNLKLQEEEVQAVKWGTKNEILEAIHNCEFIPYFESFINFIFELQNNFCLAYDKDIK